MFLPDTPRENRERSWYLAPPGTPQNSVVEPGPGSPSSIPIEVASQHSQKIHQVLLLQLRQLHVETAVVKIHQLAQRLHGAIRKIRRACRQPTKLLHHDGAHVDAAPRNQSTPRIAGVDHTAQIGMRRSI